MLFILIIRDEKYTISRNRAKENSPNITINGVTTNFPTLKETQDYLFSIIFKDIDLESLPSFRTLLSILIRDEDSEFKDIAKNSIGEFVDISNLGKFMIVKKNARIVRNPKTGQTLQMSEYYSPKFQPKSIYKETIKSAIIQKETEVKTNV